MVVWQGCVNTLVTLSGRLQISNKPAIIRVMNDATDTRDMSASPQRGVIIAGILVAGVLAVPVWSNLLSGHHQAFERVAAAPPVKVIEAPRSRAAASTTNTYPSSSVSVSVVQKNAATDPGNDPLGQLILQTGSLGEAQPASTSASMVDQPGIALDAQRALSTLQFYDGPVDGLIGPAYEDAVRKYQAMNGLPVTGVVTRPVLDHMQMAAAVAGAASTDVVIHRVQMALTELGYTPGEIDGRMGEQTREAIRTFEADRGWDVTGGISDRLLAELTGSGDLASANPD